VPGAECNDCCCKIRGGDRELMVLQRASEAVAVEFDATPSAGRPSWKKESVGLRFSREAPARQGNSAAPCREAK
jgi:hypothetical protein